MCLCTKMLSHTHTHTYIHTYKNTHTDRDFIHTHTQISLPTLLPPYQNRMPSPLPPSPSTHTCRLWLLLLAGLPAVHLQPRWLPAFKCPRKVVLRHQGARAFVRFELSAGGVAAGGALPGHRTLLFHRRRGRRDRHGRRSRLGGWLGHWWS